MKIEQLDRLGAFSIICHFRFIDRSVERKYPLKRTGKLNCNFKLVLLQFILLAYLPSTGQNKTSLNYGLAVGESVPDIPINNIINYEKSSLNFSELKGKSVLIDFWATWCAPCIKNFPKLDSIQKKHSDKLQIILVTKEDKEVAKKVLEAVNKKYSISHLSSAVNDTLLSMMFKHIEIPHYVWINQEGIVKAITGSEELTEKNVVDLINENDIALPIKRDVSKNPVGGKPIFGFQNMNSVDELKYQSVITKGIKQGLLSVMAQEPKHVYATNINILRLYQLAYGRNRMEYLDVNRIILERFSSEDSIKIGRFARNSGNLSKKMFPEIAYSYELFIPDSSVSLEQKFSMMEQDLNRYFGPILGITGRFITVKTKVLALVRTSNKELFKFKEGKRDRQHSDYLISTVRLPMESFVSSLQAYASHDSDLPIINGTQYTDLVDITISGDLSSIANINKELAKYGLKLKEKKTKLKMIILTKENKK